MPCFATNKRFNAQHQPGKLTAGRYLTHFGQGMALVGGKEKMNIVCSVFPQTP